MGEGRGEGPTLHWLPFDTTERSVEIESCRALRLRAAVSPFERGGAARLRGSFLEIGGEPKILAGIAVTNIPNHRSHQHFIVGNLPALHVSPEQVAQDATEIIVARIRHERT